MANKRTLIVKRKKLWRNVKGVGFHVLSNKSATVIIFSIWFFDMYVFNGFRSSSLLTKDSGGRSCRRTVQKHARQTMMLTAKTWPIDRRSSICWYSFSKSWGYTVCWQSPITIDNPMRASHIRLWAGFDFWAWSEFWLVFDWGETCTEKQSLELKLRCAKIPQYYRYRKWLCGSWSTKRESDRSVLVFFLSY